MKNVSAAKNSKTPPPSGAKPNPAGSPTHMPRVGGHTTNNGNGKQGC